jgi:LuxR family transcriptional regulator, maltose regulon positive regulatory protein
MAARSPTRGKPAASRRALLESKLHIPSRRPNIVRRTALLDRLRSTRRTPVVVVEAPAGYGKTTALAAWVRADRRRISWYSIDARDADPAVFVAYLAAALSRAGADVRNVSGVTAPGTPIQRVAAELGRAFASLDAPAVVVLDNAGFLTSPACLEVLAVLLDHVPDGSQLVLSARSEAKLPFARLGADGRLLLLGVADLKFSDAEANSLLRSVGVQLSGEHVRSLNALCEGWPAGLYLAALVARRSGGHVADELFGADRFLADYFHSELLDQLREDRRQFLLESSIVPRLCGPLCDAMMGRSGSAGVLSSLAKANLFISPLAGEPGWFALQRLFREMLEAELARRHPGRRIALLARATDWYEAEGEVESAIECAIAAGDRHRAAGLLDVAALDAFWSGRAATLERWLAAIDDPATLAKHPGIAVIGSAMHANWGHPYAAERWAQAALRCDTSQEMPDGSRAEAWIATLRAFLCADGVEAMREDAQLAVDMLEPGSSFSASSKLCLGFAHLFAGDEERAADWFAKCVDAASAIGATVGASFALSALSLMAGARGELREQDALARRAREIVDEAGLGDYVLSAFVFVAGGRAALALGRRSRAQQDLRRADRLVPGLTFALPWVAVPTRIELAHLHLAFANPARASELLDEIDEITARRPGLGVLMQRVEGLRHDLAAGRSAGDGWSSALTPAELRLLPLLASYLSFREIADRLGISRNTVKTQAIAVYRKLEVSSRSEAVARARETGLLRDVVAID